MNRKQLEHVLRALSHMLQDSREFAGTFVLFGSQAILAHLDPDFFPEAGRDGLPPDRTWTGSRSDARRAS